MTQTDANERFEMSRGTHTSTGRCLVVWLLVTAAALATWSTVADAAASLGSATVWRGQFEDLLVAVASAVLAGCAAWLWLITTVTVADVARGRVSTPAPRGLTRRLVLAACGAAVVAGVGSPALAGGHPSSDPTLAGLPMPDRAVVTATAHPAGSLPAPRPAVRRTPPAAATTRAPVIVRPGDSLWSIAASGLEPSADAAEIDAAWRALYAANRAAIGADPDLIRPGIHLTPDPTREARP